MIVIGAVLVAALMMPRSAVHAQKPILLRYKMEPNKPLIYKMTTNTKQVQTVRNMKIETVMSNTEISIRTLKGFDKSKNLELQTENKLLNVKVKIGPLGEYKYDSKSDENERGSTLGAALTPLYDTLNGAYETIVMSPRGEIVETKGFAELVASALKDNPLGKQFAGNGTNTARKFSLAEFFPVLSKAPVKPGDTWEEPYEIELPKLGKAKGTRKFKFVGYEMVGKTKTAKITYTTEMTFDIDLNIGGQKITGKMTMEKSAGTVNFDPQKGQLVKLKSGFTMGGDINVSVNGMDIPIGTKQTQTITLERLTKLPE
ncbi:MAG: hypothetical protein Tsb009_05120 [Planctomycetaceae bacterium]